MMTAEEAIRRIENHIQAYGIGERPHIRIAEALYMAIDALAAQGCTDDRRVLTQEQLREMDGQEVFCRELNDRVKVVAYRTGFIYVTYSTPRDVGVMRAMNLTLYSEGRNGS